ncbi:Vps62-related protein [Bradyrhizobium prioriisuperbiae]|uniref:Vps62-related protein n=1 Tax=Bradyrhizobium prioriisuperbiae TaxID=2854389 RepID=UPI0028E62763|nr:Vps62-related protein [Bradyrhizobium prioritasuperba]
MPLPVLNIQPTMDFSQVVQDTTANTAVTIFRPNTPDGWFFFGDYCQPGTQAPLSSGFVVQVVTDVPTSPALAAPTGWNFVTGGFTSLFPISQIGMYACWAPVAPQGYVGCGHVWTSVPLSEAEREMFARSETDGGPPKIPDRMALDSFPPPNIPNFRCLNANVAKSYPLTSLIWDDHGSGCNLDTSCWSIAPLATFFVWPQNGVTPTVSSYIPSQPIPESPF